MSYHRIAATASARAVTEKIDAERRLAIARAEAALQSSRDWLEQYRAQPRPTRFDWRPSLPAIKPTVTPFTPGETNGKEIEGEFSVVADADAPREAGGREGPQLGGQAIAHDGVEHPARQGDGQAEEESEGPFIPF